jgi:phospholipid/cholesterol/gamma-HCH transport system substrate-binding protein
MVRVGLLITVSLAVLMIFLFFIGSEQKIWSRKNEYEVRFFDVAGLAEGNPVKISGVTVGVVKDITLPQDAKQSTVRIQLMVDRKYSQRIRGDSRARLKKLGLLAGDAYIDVTPGSQRYPELEPGSIVPAQKQTNVDQLLSSGEDLVDNLVQISYSMKNVLARVDRGEGLLGEMTSSPATKQRLTDTVLTALNKTNALFSHIESGRGVVGKLVYDDQYGEQLTSSIASTAQSLQTVSANLQRSFESGTGTIPALLNDPGGKKRVLELVDNLRVTSANLAAFTTTLQSGQGLVPRLMNDKAYGDQALNEFTMLVRQLNDAVAKLNSGQGTAGKMISDPSVYESINDILIGINESRMLRWLIRSRQESGIEKRYNQERKSGPAPAAPTSAAPASGRTSASQESAPPAVPVIATPVATATDGHVAAGAPVTAAAPAPSAPVAPPAPQPAKPNTDTTPPASTSTAPPPPTSTAPPPPAKQP